MSWAAWLSALRRDAMPFSRGLSGLPHAAIFWECRPDRRLPYQDKRIPAPALAGLRGDPSPFEGRLREPVNVFRNLSGESLLVAPSATGDYPHLLSFVRGAPEGQVQAFWTAVADAVDGWRGPLYLSTSGLGVAWLHVRLDPRPKYFTDREYRGVPREVAAMRHASV